MNREFLASLAPVSRSRALTTVHSLSFKRKQRQQSRSKFRFPNFFSNSSAEPATSTGLGSWFRNEQRSDDAQPLGEPINNNGNGNLAHKDSGFLDWYVEGPGRRVGYDNLTAIDWIFEYTKERQRKRLLYASGQGVVGYLRKLLDASNVWIVLIATGVLVGIIAAGIDVASDWLADLKTGYCKAGPGGGRFYLNRSFCCWGHDGKPLFSDISVSLLTDSLQISLIV